MLVKKRHFFFFGNMPTEELYHFLQSWTSVFIMQKPVERGLEMYLQQTLLLWRDLFKLCYIWWNYPNALIWAPCCQEFKTENRHVAMKNLLPHCPWNPAKPSVLRKIANITTTMWILVWGYSLYCISLYESLLSIKYWVIFTDLGVVDANIIVCQKTRRKKWEGRKILCTERWYSLCAPLSAQSASAPLRLPPILGSALRASVVVCSPFMLWSLLKNSAPLLVLLFFFWTVRPKTSSIS